MPELLYLNICNFYNNTRISISAQFLFDRSLRQWRKSNKETYIMRLEMRILGLIIDSKTNSPVVVLWNRKTRTKLSFYIGILEAAAIATELEQIQFTHPMTHDLIKKLMNHLGVRVKGVELCDLRNDTYYNWIYLDVNGKETKIDSRTSDALAIALRMKAPIYVNERVLDKLKEKRRGAKPEIQNKESRKWTEMLEKMKPEDFGRYKM